MGRPGAAAAGAMGPRPGNKRPVLLAPRLQTLLSLPPDFLWQHWRWWLKRPFLAARFAGGGAGGDGAVQVDAPESWGGDVAAGLRLLEGEFRFAGQSLTAPASLRRPGGGATPAWHAGLAAFSWLDDLKAVGSPAARHLAKQLAARWHEEYGRFDPLAWRADLTALRLRAILLNHAYLEINQDAAWRGRIVPQLRRQARFLATALPELLHGADLLQAAVSLMLCGLALPGGEALWRRGRALFRKELGRQMLGDGGHIERSPRLMLELLRHFIDLRDLCRLARRPLPDHLAPAIEQLAAAIDCLRHDDGGLAGFNDTWESEPDRVERALARAVPAPRLLNALPETGFQRLEAGMSVVIIDAGPPPPHGFDAHAHAGTLAFEMSHDGERLIVNCGAHPCAADWRGVQRTTAAHSTVTVDNVNSAILLPQASPPRGLAFGLALPPRQVACRRDEQDGQTWIDCSHDGYREGFGLIHRRRLYLAADGLTLMGEDHLRGPGGNSFALRFHLHPGVHASLTQDGRAALLRPGGRQGGRDAARGGLWRLRVAGGDLALAESVAIGAGGVRRAQQVTVMGALEKDETEIRWILQREGKAPAR